ncbi:hypothetical protein GOBAR_DD04576 [Gossypium barbadense]|nr:hypothetical protein GOBAR_DD04576 [Gossypium barbadense]
MAVSKFNSPCRIGQHVSFAPLVVGGGFTIGGVCGFTIGCDGGGRIDGVGGFTIGSDRGGRTDGVSGFTIAGLG